MLQLATNRTIKAADRPLPLRMRSDLEIRPRTVRGQLSYTLKDPLTLTYHRLWLEEFTLLQMLDGRASASQIKQQFESRFQGKRLDLTRLEILIGTFFRSGLLVSDRSGQADWLWQRRGQKLKQHKREWLNLLALRLPGINPSRFLTWLNGSVGWLFSISCLWVGGLFMLLSALWMLTHWSDVAARMPGLNSYLTPSNLPWMLLTIGGLKVLHELGHGLACMRLGGHCHEMGVLLLAGVPCLYCDVSDSWTVSQAWKRAFIALAGIWIELLVAALCVWLWWFSRPGLLNTLCFNVMLVGSVSTLLINGNPLLRYDGYFVLADLLEIPNLWRQSRLVLVQQLDRFFFRRPTLLHNESPELLSGYLSLYALASIVCQWLALGTMFFVLFAVLRNAKLDMLAALLMLAGLALAGRPVIKLSRLIVRSDVRKNVRIVPSLLVLLLIGTAAVVTLVPIAHTVRVPVLVQISNYRPVTVVEAGRLDHVIAEGAMVKPNDVLAQLSSPQLQLELAARQGELDQQSTRLLGLQSKRPSDSIITAQITSTQEAVRGLQAEVERLRAAIDRLTIRAPAEGTILAPPIRVTSNNDWETTNLDSWIGTPLDSENHGCELKSGDMLCVVGDPKDWNAIGFFTQSQIELLRAGDGARVRSAACPDSSWSGAIVDISDKPLTQLPTELARAQLIPTLDSSKAIEPTFVATIKLQPQDMQLMTSSDGPLRMPLHNASGWATIQVAPQSLAYRAWRWFDATFSVN